MLKLPIVRHIPEPLLHPVTEDSPLEMFPLTISSGKSLSCLGSNSLIRTSSHATSKPPLKRTRTTKPRNYSIKTPEWLECGQRIFLLSWQIPIQFRDDITDFTDTGERSFWRDLHQNRLANSSLVLRTKICSDSEKIMRWPMSHRWRHHRQGQHSPRKG